MIDTLAGKSAVVTGASSGIGAATAVRLASSGVSLLLMGRDTVRLDQVAARARTAGAPQVRTMTGDVGSADVVRAAVDDAVESFGNLDIAFANAGTTGAKAMIADYDDDVFDELLHLDVRGPYLLLKHALRVMAPRRCGCFVVTGSHGSERGLPTAVGYTVAKHAILALVRTAAVEYGHLGIRANAVLPGLVDTPLLERELAAAAGEDRAARAAVVSSMSPRARPARPHEVADVVAFLASDAAAFVNGVAIPVDAGAYAAVGGTFLRPDSQ